VHQVAHEDEAFVNHGDEGIRADVEGQINVDELEAAGVLDLAAQGPGFQGGEDEFVGPALDLPAGHVNQVVLNSGTCFQLVALFG